MMFNQFVGMEDIIDYSGVCLLVTKALEDPDSDHTTSVTKKQTQAGWVNNATPEVGGATLTSAQGGSGTVEIKYIASTGKITIGGIEATERSIS